MTHKRECYSPLGATSRSSGKNGRQQNSPAAPPAVPWLLGCSALRAKDALRPAKRELGFAGLGQALRAHLVTQIGFTECS